MADDPATGESPFAVLEEKPAPRADASSSAANKSVTRPAPAAETGAAGSKPSFVGKVPPTVVVRRKRRGHAAGGHGGGAWKIAYADFVTAMMAFFLLLWLLSSANHTTLMGIAEYFNRPLKAAFMRGPGAAATTSPQSDEHKKAQQKVDEEHQLSALQQRLTTTIAHSPKLQAFKNQIKIEITSEGLQIQIIDDKNRPMFDVGNAELKDYTQAILAQIAPALNGVPNHISVAGHTDSLTYSGGQSGFSNWELSSNRANAARRELVNDGMNGSKVLQVRGLADAIPLIKNDPANPANRRITIVVLNREAEDNIRRDGAATSVTVGQTTPLALPSPDADDTTSAP